MAFILNFLANWTCFSSLWCSSVALATILVQWLQPPNLQCPHRVYGAQPDNLSGVRICSCHSPTRTHTHSPLSSAEVHSLPRPDETVCSAPLLQPHLFTSPFSELYSRHVPHHVFLSMTCSFSAWVSAHVGPLTATVLPPPLC